MSTLRVGTLFSGIGTPEYALKKINVKYEAVFACEWDKFARDTYLANHEINKEHFYQDIHNFDGAKYKNKVDLIVGGSPCQSFSMAGYRKGTSDERGQLIYQYIRVIDEVRPKNFIYENVKGMLSIDKGETVSQFMELLSELGYKLFADVVNTKDYGIPQNRERLYITGELTDKFERCWDISKSVSNARLGEILKKNQKINWWNGFSYAKPFALETKLKDILEKDVEDRYYLNDKFINSMQLHSSRHKEKGNGFNFEPLSAEKTKYSKCITSKYGQRTTDMYLKEEPKLIMAGKLDIKGNDSIKRVYDEDGISPALTTMAGGNRQPKVLEKSNGFLFGINNTRKGMENQSHLSREYSQKDRVYSIDGESPTIMAQESQGRYHILEPQICAMRGRNPESPTSRVSGLPTKQMIEVNRNGTSNALTTVQKDNLVLEFDNIETKKTVSHHNKGCLTKGVSSKVENNLNANYRIRKLTPRECFRLQGFGDDFIIDKVSNSQAYKQAGNGMSVNILEMIFCSLYGIEDSRFQLLSKKTVQKSLF